MRVAQPAPDFGLCFLVALSFFIPLSSATIEAADERCDVYGVTWRGVGYQFDNDHTWTIEMLVNEVPVGVVAGTISYPSLGCGGTLTYLGDRSEFHLFQEDLTFGLDECINGGTIDVALCVNPEVPGVCELVWTWYWPNGEVGAAAVLNQ